jgi:hypothetical protein
MVEEHSGAAHFYETFLSVKGKLTGHHMPLRWAGSRKLVGAA